MKPPLLASLASSSPGSARFNEDVQNPSDLIGPTTIERRPPHEGGPTQSKARRARARLPPTHAPRKTARTLTQPAVLLRIHRVILVGCSFPYKGRARDRQRLQTEPTAPHHVT
jgi:hypothetical protein